MIVLSAQARFCAGLSADLLGQGLGQTHYVAWLGEQRRMDLRLTQHSYCVCSCIWLSMRTMRAAARVRLTAPFWLLCLCVCAQWVCPCLRVWFVTCSVLPVCFAGLSAPLALGLSEGVGCSTRLVDHLRCVASYIHCVLMARRVCKQL
jgi:hypothetical protein